MKVRTMMFAVALITISVSAQSEVVSDVQFKDWHVLLGQDHEHGHYSVISTNGSAESVFGLKLFSDGRLLTFIKADDRKCETMTVSLKIDGLSSRTADFMCLSGALTLGAISGAGGQIEAYDSFLTEMEKGVRLQLSGGGGKTLTFSLMGFSKALDTVNRWGQLGEKPN